MINAQIIFVVTMLVMLSLVICLQLKFNLLKDNSIQEKKKTFSFARTQLVWWTFIVLSTIVAIIWASGKIPTLSESTLILLGIGSLTTVAAKLTDISDYNKAVTNSARTAADAIKSLARNQEKEGFFLDILSDKDGISVHRLQAVLFNFVFGAWFLYEVYQNINGLYPGTISEIKRLATHLKALETQTQTSAIVKEVAALKEKLSLLKFDNVIPIIETKNLVLLGLSASTYAALKTTENKPV